MKYGNTNEILLSDLLRMQKMERGDLNDLRELWKDVNELKLRIEKCGSLKVGRDKFKNVDSDNIEKLIINIVLRWRVIKMGI